TLEADRFPMVEIEGVARAGTSPLRFEGVLRLHGVERPVIASLLVSRLGPRVAVPTLLSIDLDAYGVSAPQIGSVRAGNRVEIVFAARMRVNQAAALSGGRFSPPS